MWKALFKVGTVWYDEHTQALHEIGIYLGDILRQYYMNGGLFVRWLVKSGVLLLSVLLLVTLFAPAALANSAAPPSLTVIVTFPPGDLTLSVRYVDGQESKVIPLERQTKAWEAYYRTYQQYRDQATMGAVLVVSSSEKSFECPIPESVLRNYSGLVRLDFRGETLTEGEGMLRTGVLIALRVVLTLLIEGGVFFLFGYRAKKSWITFLCVNLLTQTGLNLLLTGVTDSYLWIPSLVVLEIIIFLVEAVALLTALEEKKRVRTLLYTFTANAASFLLGGAMIAFLPV